MTFTNPPKTWADGDDLSGSALNLQLRDQLAALASPPRCRVIDNSGVSMVNGVATVVTFDSELYDYDWGNAAGSFHSTISNTSRVTVPYSGTYYVAGAIRLPVATYTGDVAMAFRKNGSVFFTQRFPPPAGIAIDLAREMELEFAAGDYIEIAITQTSGANRTLVATTSSLTVRLVGLS